MTPWQKVAVKNLRRDAATERTWAERWRKVGNEAMANKCKSNADTCDAKADELEGSEQ